ncbi:hypothetical protein [Variovorax paradoxus]|nr:hypothetical protein [Variovorax paradoxus]
MNKPISTVHVGSVFFFHDGIGGRHVVQGNGYPASGEFRKKAT